MKTTLKLPVMLLLSMFALPFTANAGIFYDFVGTCEVSCDRFGLSNGDAFEELRALEFFDTTDTSVGATFDETDIASFTIFGIDFLNTNIENGFGVITTAMFTAGGGISSFTLDNSPGTQINGFCFNSPVGLCGTPGRFDTYVSGEYGIAEGFNGHGPATFQASATAVPLPPSLALLGFGLLGLARRRRS